MKDLDRNIDKHIRIVLVDDQELIRYGLRRMLEQQADMQVVGDYPNARQAFAGIAQLRPDIVLMDAQMPELILCWRFSPSYHARTIVLPWI